MNSIAGQTLGSAAGQPLELFTWAPSIRYGAPSTNSAYRPSLCTICGIESSSPRAGGFSRAKLAAINIANQRLRILTIVMVCILKSIPISSPASRDYRGETQPESSDVCHPVEFQE